MGRIKVNDSIEHKRTNTLSRYVRICILPGSPFSLLSTVVRSFVRCRRIRRRRSLPMFVLRTSIPFECACARWHRLLLPFVGAHLRNTVVAIRRQSDWRHRKELRYVCATGIYLAECICRRLHSVTHGERHRVCVYVSLSVFDFRCLVHRWFTCACLAS